MVTIRSKHGYHGSDFIHWDAAPGSRPVSAMHARDIE